MQVVSIETDGTISGLQVKPGKGFDLRAIGAAEIKRASEVVWSAKRQKWYVEIVRGALKGQEITTEMLGKAMASRFGTAPMFVGMDDTALFDEYDEAVKAEILVLDELRLHLGAAALR